MVYYIPQLGDAVLGTYLRNPYREEVNSNNHINSNQYLIDNNKEYFSEFYNNSESVQIFNLYNRGFNFIFNGNWMVYDKTDMTHLSFTKIL